VHHWFENRQNTKATLNLTTIENCFKVQVFSECFLETIPQMILQVTINNQTTWDSPAKFSFAMSILLFLRDIAMITLYMAKKFIDQSSNPLIRPEVEGKYYSSKVDMEASVNISNYLLDQKDDAVD